MLLALFFVLLLLLISGYLFSLGIAYLSVSYEYTAWFHIFILFSYPFFKIIFQPFHFHSFLLDILNQSLKPYFPLIVQSFGCDNLSLNWKMVCSFLIFFLWSLLTCLREPQNFHKSHLQISKLKLKYPINQIGIFSMAKSLLNQGNMLLQIICHPSLRMFKLDHR
jgi:hypothetical protein